MTRPELILFGEVGSVSAEIKLCRRLLLSALSDVRSEKGRPGFLDWMGLSEDVEFGARWLCREIGLPFCRYERFVNEYEYKGKRLRRLNI